MFASPNLIFYGGLHELVAAHRAKTGAQDLNVLNEFIRYVDGQSLLSNTVIYPMKSAQNYGSGPTVAPIGELTSNAITLVNSPTWGGSGIAFASAGSEYGTIADFLGSETLTIFHRAAASGNNGGTLVSQQQNTGTNRSFVLAESYADANSVLVARSADGGTTNYEIYDTPASTFPTADTSFVAQFVDGGGINLWLNKSAQTLGLIFGTPQTSRFNTSVNIMISGALPDAPANFADQTVHASAFITGTLTTTQRETITDLINAL